MYKLRNVMLLSKILMHNVYGAILESRCIDHYILCLSQFDLVSVKPHGPVS